MELNAYSSVIETFVRKHADGRDAAFHAASCRPLFDKVWRGPHLGLSPATDADERGIAKAIAAATGRPARNLVMVSASGRDRDRRRRSRNGDLFRLLYLSLIKGDPSLRMARIIAERHGRASGRFLDERKTYLLGMLMHESGFNDRLRVGIMAGFGGDLSERLASLPGLGRSTAIEEALTAALWYVHHGCMINFLRYAMAGDDEGTYALLPTIEGFSHAMPLAELAGDPGSWLVLCA